MYSTHIHIDILIMGLSILHLMEQEFYLTCVPNSDKCKAKLVYGTLKTIVGSCELYALKKPNALYALNNQTRTFIFQRSSIKLQYTY